MINYSKIKEEKDLSCNRYKNALDGFNYANSDENICKTALTVWDITENAVQTLTGLYIEKDDPEMNLDQQILYLNEDKNVIPSGITGDYLTLKKVLYGSCQYPSMSGNYNNLNRNEIIEEIKYTEKFLENVWGAIEKRFPEKESIL